MKIINALDSLFLDLSDQITMLRLCPVWQAVTSVTNLLQNIFTCYKSATGNLFHQKRVTDLQQISLSCCKSVTQSIKSHPENPALLPGYLSLPPGARHLPFYHRRFPQMPLSRLPCPAPRAGSRRVPAYCDVPSALPA